MQSVRCHGCGIAIEEGESYFSYESQKFCESCFDDKLREFVEEVKGEAENFAGF